jgi:hypothetical protein
MRYEGAMPSEPKRSRAWRFEHTWWLFLILFSFGLLSWASFGYIAYRTKVRRWFLWAGAYLGLLGVAGAAGVASDAAAGFIIIGVWAASFVHGLAIREEVLDRLSFDEDPRLRSARSRMLTREAAEGLAERAPTVALEAGIGQDADSFGRLVDVNNAPASELARLPGFTQQLAEKVVEVRDHIGGFDSVLDFATVLDLPPNVVAALRERAVCLPR